MSVTPLLRVSDMTDWSQIVQEHGPLVWRTAYRLLNQDADAADCFQRTFVSALEVALVERVRHWPALLRRLATARALDQLRQRRRETDRMRSGFDEALIPDKSAAPDQAAAASELAEHLRRALAELEPRQAQVFCLACLEEVGYAEIAQQPGITVNHVGVLLNRARGDLRERLRAHAPGGPAIERKVQP